MMPSFSIQHAIVDKMACYSLKQRQALERVRQLVISAANSNPPVLLIETLKWNQLAFLPDKPNIGTTIRLDATVDGQIAAYFHCKTTLVDTFRELYPKTFRFEGNRALIMHADNLPESALKHCFALALTYHQDKRRRSF